MYKYKVKQTETKSYFFKWFESEQVKVYSFNTYKEALIFALSEEIKQFTCIVSDKVQTTRKTYKNHLTLKQFEKAATNNPMYYLGTQTVKCNLESYYFYLIGSSKLNKLKKH
jgi:type IV secretory pathway VirB9-like protein